jgi:hypothetical protein
MTAFEARHTNDIQPFLAGWRAAVNEELRTNTRGFLPRSYPSLHLPEYFPNLEVMECYVNPVCSARFGGQGGGPLRDTGEMNIAKIAEFCEAHFGEWGYESAIVKRFRTLIWPGAVMRVLRRAALEADEREKTRRIEEGQTDLIIRGAHRPAPKDGVGLLPAFVETHLNNSSWDRRAAAFANQSDRVEALNPHAANPLLAKIVGTRSHVSTDRLLEYRVEVAPAQLVALARSGLKGTHAEPSSISAADAFDEDYDGDIPQSSQRTLAKTPKKLPPAPDSLFRMWLPASMLQQAHPALVHAYEVTEAGKKAGKRKTAGKAKAKAISVMEDEETDVDEPVQPSPPCTPVAAAVSPTTDSALVLDQPTQRTLPKPRPIRRLLAEIPEPTPSQSSAHNSRPGPTKSVEELLAGSQPSQFLFTIPYPDRSFIWGNEPEAISSLGPGNVPPEPNPDHTVAHQEVRAPQNPDSATFNQICISSRAIRSEDGPSSESVARKRPRMTTPVSGAAQRRASVANHATTTASISSLAEQERALIRHGVPPTPEPSQPSKQVLFMNQGGDAAGDTTDEEIIEVFTDDEDDLPSAKQRILSPPSSQCTAVSTIVNGAPHAYPTPASSQVTAVNYSGSFIDLT